MQPHAAERRHLERQISYARLIFLVLAQVDLLQQAPQNRSPHAAAFLLTYLGMALGLLWLQRIPRCSDWRVPLAADVGALGVVLILAQSAAAFRSFYLFVALLAGIRWGLERSILLAGGVTLAGLLRASLPGPFDGWP